MAITKNVAATVAVAGVLAVGAAVASAAPAAADPAPPPAPADPAAPAAAPPPADPAPPAPPPGALDRQAALSLLGPQAAAPGAPAAPVGGTPFDLFLSQNPTPTVGSTQPLPAFGLGSLLNEYQQDLLPPGDKLTEQGQQSMYSAGPPDPNAPPPDKWEELKRAHGLWHMAMGKLTPDQLGQPLDGTAPLPGTHLPPGIVDLPDQPPSLFPALLAPMAPAPPPG